LFSSGIWYHAVGREVPDISKQYNAFILKGLAGIENSKPFIQDVGNQSLTQCHIPEDSGVLLELQRNCVCAGTEDGGLDSSLTGSQESLYAAEDSSMELEYSSSDKVPKT